MNTWDRFTERWLHVTERLDEAAENALSTAVRAAQEMHAALEQTRQRKRTAQQDRDAACDGTDRWAWQRYVERLEQSEQAQLRQLGELSGMVEQRRGEAVSAHQEARKWDQVATDNRRQRTDENQRIQQRGADELAVQRFGREVM